MERVNFYIDGFNFYYGIKRLKERDPDWKLFYWLDLVKLFEHFIGENQVLQKVYYFTASPLREQKKQRQNIFLRANKLLNGNRFEVVKGKFYEKNIDCPLCKGYFVRPEEKRTDVNISVRMMGDCALDNADTLVLVCADSDLVPPLQFIKEHYPDKKIKVYFPPDNFSSDLYNFIKNNKGKVVKLENSKGRFSHSIMPDVVSKDGQTVTIPEKWKERRFEIF
jgi:uncharacterized LabA/DUF88 family protein